MYLCGPTVYKPSHIGHMVGPVIFDAVKRHLAYSGYQVTLVVNITDVDDKLINESTARKMTMAALADEMTADYQKNLQAMGVDTIDHFPKATDYMAEIVAITQTLIDKGFAYASEGDVYFDVAKDREYGKLTNRSVESMHGDGGGTAERKRSSADFALWKSAKPGEPAWDSPWGKGRPGWHIECSAMSSKLLGETFDIHGGGLDLVFPHHENEIAQSECAHGKPQAKYWMHNGLMQSSGESGKVGGRNTREISEGDQAAQEAGKIGKSKGASAFRDLLKNHQPETIRFFLLSTHYRRPIDYSEDRLQETNTALAAFYRYFERYKRVTGEEFYALEAPKSRAAGEVTAGNSPLLAEVKKHRDEFLAMMDDDFNTGGGIGVLFELVRGLNRWVEQEKLEDADRTAPGFADKVATLQQATRVLRDIAAVLGLFRQPLTQAAGAADDGKFRQLVELFIDERSEARKRKDFAAGDRIRDKLASLGIVLVDRKGVTEWTMN